MIVDHAGTPDTTTDTLVDVRGTNNSLTKEQTGILVLKFTGGCPASVFNNCHLSHSIYMDNDFSDGDCSLKMPLIRILTADFDMSTISPTNLPSYETASERFRLSFTAGDGRTAYKVSIDDVALNYNLQERGYTTLSDTDTIYGLYIPFSYVELEYLVDDYTYLDMRLLIADRTNFWINRMLT